MWPNEKTLSVVRYNDLTNPRWRTAAILDFDNFGVDQHFCAKFGTVMENQGKGR